MINILVLCTGNSARSILGEALFGGLGKGRVQAFSAGSRPAGKVNPFAVERLQAEGFDTSNFRSKSWDEFTGEGAPEIDIVVTVCGNAAGETCPVWIGGPVTAHWGYPDPAGVEGSDGEIRAAFKQVYDGLKANIEALLALDIEGMDKATLKARMLEIHAVGGNA